MPKTQILRSSLTSQYLKDGRRKQRNWFAVTISLPHCRGFISLEQRLDRDALAGAVPRVLGYIFGIINSKFPIQSKTHEAIGFKSRYTFLLQDGAAIYLTLSESDIKIEAFSKNKETLNKIREALNDIKLKLNRGATADDIAILFSQSKRNGRATAGKIIAEAADYRFLSLLRDRFINETSHTVRREALRGLGQLSYRGKHRDFKKGLESDDEVVRLVSAAFLYGNRFKLGGEAIYFPPDAVPPFSYEKTAGCLLGQALGDMLGRPLEFLSRDEIKSQFGYPVQGPVVSTNPQILFGQYSDDTELSLLAAESIDHDLGFIPELFGALLAEHVFQIDTFGIPNNGYGAATLRAGRRLYSGTPWMQSGVDASTCGPALRVGPLAIFYQNDWVKLEEAIIHSSVITHSNQRAIAGAVAVGLAVARLLNSGMDPAPSSFVKWLRDQIALYDIVLAEKIEYAARMALDETKPAEQVYQALGNSSESDETIPTAFYAFLRSPRDFRQSIITAINAGGDADSIGSLTGYLSGAFNGVGSIPREWLSNLRDSSLVYKAIRRLAFERT